MKKLKEKIHGILINFSQKSVIGLAVEEDDFDNVSEEIVKNLHLSVVSQQRELLIAYSKYLETRELREFDCYVDDFIKIKR